MDCQQVVVVPLQDAGVEGGHVCFASNVSVVDLCGGKVAAKDEVEFVNLRPAPAAREDAAVSNHSAHVVVFVQDGRRVGEQGLEVTTDGEDILVTGVVVVHELAHTHPVLSQGEVIWHINVMRNLFPARHTNKLGSADNVLCRNGSHHQIST